MFFIYIKMECITEERVREIFSEMNAIARQSYTQDAYELAMKRVGMFEELLMSKVEQVGWNVRGFPRPTISTPSCEKLKKELLHQIENRILKCSQNF